MLPEKYINKLICCDCVKGMKEMPSECIPATVTSPPYDKLRDYGKHPFDFEAIAKELWRVTMPGGVLIWVVQDAIVDGDQTGTSFRQCLYFMELGFSLHNTIVCTRKGGRTFTPNRYGGPLEFAFVFSKGKPRYVHLIRDKRNKHAGETLRFKHRRKDGSMEPPKQVVIHTWGVRCPIWEYAAGGNLTTKDKGAYKHPALMPELMAEDLIISFSRPNDIIFDPFAGGATTCKMALLNNRRYLGMEIHRLYYEGALKRMETAKAELRRRLDESLGTRSSRTLVSPAFTYELIEGGQR